MEATPQASVPTLMSQSLQHSSRPAVSLSLGARLGADGAEVFRGPLSTGVKDHSQDLVQTP